NYEQLYSTENEIAKDADLHFPVDRSEPRVSAMVAVTLNGEKLRPFLIASQDFDEMELL
ncbi:MAG: hypothetical protein EZS28_017450, partial [Streblomastix strix]